MGKLAKIKVVTGYIPIQGHTRSAEEYGKLGYQLSDALGDRPLAVCYEKVRDTWLAKFVEGLQPQQPPLTWSKGDNPQKNSLEYHCVQHQKFAWLEKAAKEDESTDTFVWMDYGIAHQPGFSAEIVRSFLGRIRKGDFAFPGCWEQPVPDPIDQYPCWRFCGSLLIVPREHVTRLVSAVAAMARLYVRLMKNVTWEVNTLARVEPYLQKGTNFRWYKADHNAYQFTRYE